MTKPIELDALGPAPAARGRALRAAYGRFPSGVIAVCSLVGGSPVGMAVSSFTSVSVDPALVSVSVQRSSTTWPVLSTQRLGLSVLAADHTVACSQLASKDGDRFAGLEWDATDDGAVFLRGAGAWFDCTIHDAIPAGDHEIVLLQVQALWSDQNVSPLIFHASTFHELAR